jgi:hypothetical protein
MTVPADWVACDAATNTKLGAKAPPADVQAACKQVGMQGVVLLPPSAALFVQMSLEKGFRIPDRLLKNAGREVMAFLKSNLCESMQAAACDVAIRTVDGHPVYEAKVAASGNTTDVLSIPARDGTLMLTVFAQGSDIRKATATVEKLLASIKLTGVDEPAPDTVTLQAAPGVSVKVAKGWIACDDANNALLGSAPDTEQEKPVLCADPKASTLRVFNPRPYRTVTVDFQAKAEIDAERFMQDLDPRKAAAAKASACRTATDALTGVKGRIGDCTFGTGTIGPMPAQYTTVTFFDDTQRKLRHEVRTYELLNGNGLLVVRIDAISVFKPVTDPDVQAILDSVVKG